jgi:hypothetical protein
MDAANASPELRGPELSVLHVQVHRHLRFAAQAKICRRAREADIQVSLEQIWHAFGHAIDVDKEHGLEFQPVDRRKSRGNLVNKSSVPVQKQVCSLVQVDGDLIAQPSWLVALSAGALKTGSSLSASASAQLDQASSSAASGPWDKALRLASTYARIVLALRQFSAS